MGRTPGAQCSQAIACCSFSAASVTSLSRDCRNELPSYVCSLAAQESMVARRCSTLGGYNLSLPRWATSLLLASERTGRFTYVP